MWSTVARASDWAGGSVLVRAFPANLRDAARVQEDAGKDLDQRFLSKFARLEAFVLVEGRLPVQREVMEDGFQIGQWVDSLRRSHRGGRLAPAKSELIESAIPGWTWGRVAGADRRRAPYDFDEMYAGVVSYLDEFGALPPATCVYEGAHGSLPIGPWLHRKKRAMLEATLSEHEFELLRSLPGFVEPRIRRSWWDSYEVLVLFVAEYGRWPGLDDAATYPDGGLMRLGLWAQSQRYATGRNRLSVEQRTALAGTSHFPGWPGVGVPSQG